MTAEQRAVLQAATRGRLMLMVRVNPRRDTRAGRHAGRATRGPGEAHLKEQRGGGFRGDAET